MLIPRAQSCFQLSTGAAQPTWSVFVAQKRVQRAMAGTRYWRSNRALDTCKPLIKKYEIFTLYISECMKLLLSLLFIFDNQ
jgi:hypothetical protein